MSEKGAAAILGGGPSLPGDLKRIPPATLFGVNYHALRLVDPDFIVFIDFATRYLLGETSARLITNRPTVDDIYPKEAPAFTSSSHLATWYAVEQGYSPVILCGMDLYQGDNYFYDNKFVPAGSKHDLDWHILMWCKVFKTVARPEVIKAASGPLVKLFGEWIGEQIPPDADHSPSIAPGIAG